MMSLAQRGRLRRVSLRNLISFIFSSFDTRMVAYSGIWKLFNYLYDLHQLLEQPFFQIVCLFLHPSSICRLG
jgi:hypothetical protein